MSFIYSSGGFTIYPDRHIIKKENEIIHVRPKTFALLLLLVEQPQEILSKRYLLDTVWDDVTVDEPVLVQSIREIRQLFGNADIIQTYPRKGYAWIANVRKDVNDQEICTDISDIANETSPALQSIEPISQSAEPILYQHELPQHASFALKKTYLYWVAAFAFFSCILIYFISMHYANKPFAIQTAQSQTDVVVILPVKQQIPGNDHDWVYLGAMDQLILSLTSSQHTQIMGIEYVLELMQFAKISREYTSDDVTRIFNVSGATLVVESQLSGSVEEYQLDYKLHFKNGIKRGVILEKNLNEALHKLSTVIGSYTGESPSNSHFSQNAFTSELIARGLEQLDTEDYVSARSFLTSAKQLEPNNMVIRELLVKALVKSQDAALAKEEIQSTFALSQQLNTPETASMHTYLAMINLSENNAADALIQLEKADQLARKSNDVLYQAYSAQIRGYIFLQRNELPAAQQAFENALKFHDIIRCPIGMALTELDLIKVASAQHNYAQANAHFSQAKQLIEEHKLDKLAIMLAENKPEKN